jgi:hypothetical protein
MERKANVIKKLAALLSLSKTKVCHVSNSLFAAAVLTQLNLLKFSAMKMVLRNFSYIVFLALYALYAASYLILSGL